MRLCPATKSNDVFLTAIVLLDDEVVVFGFQDLENAEDTRVAQLSAQGHVGLELVDEVLI